MTLERPGTCDDERGFYVTAKWRRRGRDAGPRCMTGALASRACASLMKIGLVGLGLLVMGSCHWPAAPAYKHHYFLRWSAARPFVGGYRIHKQKDILECPSSDDAFRGGWKRSPPRSSSVSSRPPRFSSPLLPARRRRKCPDLRVPTPPANPRPIPDPSPAPVSLPLPPMRGPSRSDL